MIPSEYKAKQEPRPASRKMSGGGSGNAHLGQAPAALHRQMSEEPLRRKVSRNALLQAHPDLVPEHQRPGTSGVREEIARRVAASDFARIFREVLADKPTNVQSRFNETFGESVDLETAGSWVQQWTNYRARNDDYPPNEMGTRKLLKDAVKYQLYRNFHWRSVGAGVYMTGDATTLAVAALVDPSLTVKILKGPNLASPQDTRDFSKDAAQFSLFGPAIDRNQIRETDVTKNAARMQGGANGLYSRNYKRRNGNRPKPWNRETSHATQVAAENYLTNRDEIANLLIPESQAERDEIEAYKRHALHDIADKQCILIWQRHSGANAGAHKELDSHPEVLRQIITTVGEACPDNAIILLGDPTPELDIDALRSNLENSIVVLDRFWKDAPKVFKDRKHQNYFIKILGEQNQAVSIGMRSGSLEASALLGVNTIYIDDHANVAEKRMESFAGNAAQGRSVAGKRSKTRLRQAERSKEGTIPGYKRVGTYNQLGNEAEQRLQRLNRLADNAHKLIAQTETSVSERADGSRQLQELTTKFEKLQMVRVPLLESADRKLESRRYKATVATATKQIETLTKRNRHQFNQATLDDFKRQINRQIEDNFLLKEELSQIRFLIDYLRKASSRSGSPSIVSEGRATASEPHSDASAPASTIASPAPQSPGPVSRFARFYTAH